MGVIVKRLERQVVLTGLTDIMFDRYPGSNKTTLSDPGQKLYLNAARHICLPTLNIISFLSAINTESAPKVCLDKRLYKSICSALLSSVAVQPFPLIPFLRNGKPIVFGSLQETAEGGQRDPKSGVQVAYHVARLEKGIPNPKERPVLGLPWELRFALTVMPHPDLTEAMIEDLFTNGGVRLGLGTFRKMFGKFSFVWQ